MMRLAVVGHGTLGIVATCFADAGHRVIGIECDRDGLTALKAREPSVYEPGFGMLPPCLGSGRGVSFFVSSADIAGDLDAVVIAVWTATLPTHLAYLGQVNRVLGEVLRLKMLPRFAMTKSAIPPGAGIELVREANRSALAEGYVHCPEFFSQGRAIEKWRRPERLIIGLWTEAFLPELRDLYRRGQAPRVVARLRVHDTSQARPAEVFADLEVRHLPPRPARYDVPVFTKANVKRDHYVELGRALYSVPSKYIERPLDAHADVALIKLFCLEKVVRVHSRHRPGSRWAGLPEHTASDATSDLDSLRSAHPLHRRTTKSATAMTRSDSVLMGSELKQVLRTTGARPGARHPARPP